MMVRYFNSDISPTQYRHHTLNTCIARKSQDYPTHYPKPSKSPIFIKSPPRLKSAGLTQHTSSRTKMVLVLLAVGIAGGIKVYKNEKKKRALKKSARLDAERATTASSYLDGSTREQSQSRQAARSRRVNGVSTSRMVEEFDPPPMYLKEVPHGEVVVDGREPGRLNDGVLVHMRGLDETHGGELSPRYEDVLEGRDIEEDEQEDEAEKRHPREDERQLVV